MHSSLCHVIHPLIDLNLANQFDLSSYQMLFQFDLSFYTFVYAYIQIGYSGSSINEGVANESLDQHEGSSSKELISSKPKFRQFIFGEEALRISPTEPYCLRRPIRRGHLNISQHYPMQQV